MKTYEAGIIVIGIAIAGVWYFGRANRMAAAPAVAILPPAQSPAVGVVAPVPATPLPEMIAHPVAILYPAQVDSVVPRPILRPEPIYRPPIIEVPPKPAPQVTMASTTGPALCCENSGMVFTNTRTTRGSAPLRAFDQMDDYV